MATPTAAYRRLASRLVIAAIALVPFPALAASRPASSACSLAQSGNGNLIDVPFRQIDGRIYVEASVNSQGPYIFALDTGASGMGRADSGLTAALALPQVSEGQTSDGVKQAKVPLVRIGSLKFGGLVRKDIDVITRDYRSRLAPEAAFAGILGREFFADGLLVIDYPKGRIRFTRSARLRPDMAGAMTYEKAFRVPVSIGGTVVTGNLDTGANVAFVLPKTLYEGISNEPLLAPVVGTLTNSKIETHRVTLAGPFGLGGLSGRNLEVRVSPQFSEVLVGAHFLKGAAILIDQRTSTVAVCPASGKFRR